MYISPYPWPRVWRTYPFAEGTGYMPSYPGTYPGMGMWNIQEHIIYMNEVMKKKKYIAYIRPILYIMLVYI